MDNEQGIENKTSDRMTSPPSILSADSCKVKTLTVLDQHAMLLLTFDPSSNLHTLTDISKAISESKDVSNEIRIHHPFTISRLWNV